jgi:DNA-binding CsgD family transcriptional regulator
VELTERQRQVLRLISAGKTNAEIGEALGISLDGAKWHVSEILARLDVATREEAAEAWRARQRLGPRLRRLTGALFPATGWKAISIAAALGAVGSVALLLVLIGRESSVLTTPETSTHAWVAFAFPLPTETNAAPIRVFDALDPGTGRDLGAPGHYANPKWSPDARQLGTVQLTSENSVRFLLFDRQSGRARVIPLRGMLQDYSWSPDSSRVAAVTEEVVAVFDREGRELGSIAVPPNPDGTFSGRGLVTSNWSPDSRYFVTQPNNLLVVMDRDGQGTVYVPRDFVPGVSPGGVQAYRWASPTELLVLGVPEASDNSQRREWAVAVGPNGLTWTPTEIPPDSFYPADIRQLLDDAQSRFPNPSRRRLTANGTAVLVDNWAGQGGGVSPRFVLLHDGKETPIDLGPDAVALPPLAVITSLDVVITGPSAR